MPFTELPYQLDSADYFQNLAHLPYAIWLDSCRAFQPRGRYDVMSAMPLALIQTQNKVTTVEKEGHSYSSTEDVFKVVQSELAKLKPANINIDLPFTLGSLGYYAYDLGRQLENLNDSLKRDITLPDACVGIYDWSLVTDHEQKRSYLIYNNAEKLSPLLSLFLLPEPDERFKLDQDFKADMSRDEYETAFNKIREHLISGDCYQTNLCQRFSSSFTGSSFAAYLKLRQESPAPFSAFMNLPEGSILSLSPERFIQVKGRKALTQPIKGTAARYSDPEKDEASLQKLIESEKDRAENLMIVDLMRNDFGRCCKPGSIRVPTLFEAQSFSNVHHLVSSIEGELREDQHALDLLRHCFPGGSITGTPKISAMDIIEACEKQARSIYCGSMAYCSIDGHMDSNIAIRTLITDHAKIYAYAGGAIVIDSDSESEYQESLLKINNLLRALNG